MNELVNNKNEKFFSTSEIDKIILETKNKISDTDIEFIKELILPHFDRFEKEIQKFKELSNLNKLKEINLKNATNF
jgi:hypothetical protein